MLIQRYTKDELAKELVEAMTPLKFPLSVRYGLPVETVEDVMFTKITYFISALYDDVKVIGIKKEHASRLRRNKELKTFISLVKSAILNGLTDEKRKNAFGDRWNQLHKIRQMTKLSNKAFEAAKSDSRLLVGFNNRNVELLDSYMSAKKMCSSIVFQLIGIMKRAKLTRGYKRDMIKAVIRHFSPKYALIGESSSITADKSDHLRKAMIIIKKDADLRARFIALSNELSALKENAYGATLSDVTTRSTNQKASFEVVDHLSETKDGKALILQFTKVDATTGRRKVVLSESIELQNKETVCLEEARRQKLEEILKFNEKAKLFKVAG